MEKNLNQLESIIQIFKSSNIEDVNRYLNSGWILLNVHTEDYGHPVERHQTTHYSLGWKKENGEIIIPKSISDREKWDNYHDEDSRF